MPTLTTHYIKAIPSQTQSNTEFMTIMTYENSLDCDNEAFFQFLSSHDTKTGKKFSRQKWKDIMLKFTDEYKWKDDKIYSKLRTIYTQDNAMLNADRGRRLAHKLYKVVELLPKYVRERKYNSYLDYGCASGTITTEFAKLLDIPPENVYGADPMAYPIKDFTFIHLDKSNKLVGIPDASIDIITASMVLHHIEDIESALKEIKRVLSPNGFILIREHDCYNRRFARFLDIVHGLYALVWSSPVEDPNFIKSYMALYRSKQGWTDILLKYNLKKIGYVNQYFVDPGKFNNIRAYYAAYKHL